MTTRHIVANLHVFPNKTKERLTKCFVSSFCTKWQRHTHTFSFGLIAGITIFGKVYSEINFNSLVDLTLRDGSVYFDPANWGK